LVARQRFASELSPKLSATFAKDRVTAGVSAVQTPFMPSAIAPSLDELSLVRAAQSGDAEAFRQLFQSYYPMMHAYAYRLCLNDADAEDIAQETFIKAARALGTYRPNPTFRNWLYQICTNAARDWHRRSGRQRRLEESVGMHREIEEMERPPDHEAARDVLLALPPELRETVVLVYLEEMNHAEAAALLGCAETTVSWRIFRAKRKLKGILR
jgi:RNA polymerase sigma-70 factor (ECF subfamily)